MIKKILAVLFMILLIVSIISTSHAQENSITLNENKLGEITPQQPAARYLFTSENAAPITITVRSLSAGFAPILLLLNDQAEVIGHVRNPAAAAQITHTFTPLAAATYTIQIQGAQGDPGQFILSLAAGNQPPLSPLALQPGTNFKDQVSADEPVKIYQISSDPSAVLFIEITSDLSDSGAVAVLSDMDGHPLGTIHTRLRGGMFMLPAAIGVQYELTITHSGLDRVESYTVKLSTQPTTTSASPENTTFSTPTPTVEAFVVIPFDGPCMIATSSSVSVNIRRGPGSEYSTVAGLAPNTLTPVSGRTEDNSWWQIEYRPGLFGWVADSVIRRGGDCSNIGAASYPTPDPTLDSPIDSTPSTEEPAPTTTPSP